MTTRRLAIFDLDGTLVDTAPDLLGTLNDIMHREKLAPIDSISMRPLVGRGIVAMLEQALLHNGVERSAEALADLQQDYLKLYEGRLSEESRPFPGAKAALETLRQQDWIMAVCTNKPDSLARALLDDLSLSAYFAVIAGPEAYGVQKPDPQHVLQTMAHAGGTASTSVMVGDSIYDIEAALNAEMASVAVTFGYSTIAPQDLGANRIISHFDQLNGQLNGLVPRHIS